MILFLILQRIIFLITLMHGKNDFAKIFENLDTELEIILLDHQN